MKWIKASERLPPVGIYCARYNGDHVVLQVHDGGFRVVFYDRQYDDVPKVNLIKWLDESSSRSEGEQGELWEDVFHVTDDPKREFGNDDAWAKNKLQSKYILIKK